MRSVDGLEPYGSQQFLDLDELDLEAELDFTDSDESNDESLAEGTKKRRAHVRKQWIAFWGRTSNPNYAETIWVDLCQPGPKQDQAVKLCKKFLEIYATRSRRLRICLGPEEYELKRTMKYCASLLTMWRSLILEFNAIILGAKRRQDPENASRWTLKTPSVFSSKGSGPVNDVARWIATNSEAMGLVNEQSFVKREATPEDVVLLLQTLWNRAEHIPCNPLTRISFHNMILLAAIGGFRPGVLLNLKYSQIGLKLVLDPRTKTTRLVVDFTLFQNKQRATVIRRDQMHIIEFSIAQVRSKLLCPVSLVISRALADDAFDPPIESITALASMPMVDGVRSIKFRWKDSMLNRCIYPISYREFQLIFKRTTLVAGYPESIRPYALRVGAGSRLDGILQPALRRYILSNTTEVFERSYQPRHLRENIMSGLTPGMEQDADIFNLLRQSSLYCDEKAPIYVASEDIAEWRQSRQDLLESANDSARTNVIINTLSRLLLAKKREEYFAEAEKLRASGLSASTLAKPHTNPKRSSHGQNLHLASAVASVLAQDRLSDDGDSKIYIEMLIEFQRPVSEQKSLAEKSCTKSADQSPAVVESQSPMAIADEQQSEEVLQRLSGPQCFICPSTFSNECWQDVWDHTLKMHRIYPVECRACGGAISFPNAASWFSHVEKAHIREEEASLALRCLFGCGLYSNSNSLSRHYRTQHEYVQTACPRCDERVVHNYDEWIAHAKEDHHQRVVRADQRDGIDHKCLICHKSFPTIPALTKHTTYAHETTFSKPIPCPECLKLHCSEEIISSLYEWSSHVASSHGAAHTPNPPRARRSRCLICNEGVYNEKFHLMNRHPNAFTEPSKCQECVRTGEAFVPLIKDLKDWQIHCIVAHGKNGVVIPETCRARCLYCGEEMSAVSSHFTKRHDREGIYPFDCPECKRNGFYLQDASPIKSRQEWVVHCASKHGDIAVAYSAHYEGVLEKRKYQESIGVRTKKHRTSNFDGLD